MYLYHLEEAAMQSFFLWKRGKAKLNLICKTPEFEENPICLQKLANLSLSSRRL
jgi:hypothetical protein